MAARWRNEPRERGLASVAQLERGYELWEGGKRLVRVGPITKPWTREITGWFFVSYIGSAYINTCGDPASTKEEAKAQADAWYCEHKASRGSRG